MKKRCFLLSILLVISMMLGACGSGNPFEGKWTGKLDVTKQFEDGIKAYYPELEEYVDFEDLTFVIDVIFDDGMMTMKVDQNSVDAFNQNFADGMMNVEKGSLMALLDAAGVTLEEAVAESGMTEEDYIASRLSLPEVRDVMDNMSTNMLAITEASLAGFDAVNGPYTFNEEEIHIRYEEDKYESVAYAFEGDNLILTFKGEIQGMTFSLRIECEKQ